MAFRISALHRDCDCHTCTFDAIKRDAVKAAARGSDSDPRQIISDLISDDRAPFTPDDEQALRLMSMSALVKLHDRYLGAIGSMTANCGPNASLLAHRRLIKRRELLTRAKKHPGTLKDSIHADPAIEAMAPKPSFRR